MQKIINFYYWTNYKNTAMMPSSAKFLAILKQEAIFLMLNVNKPNMVNAPDGLNQVRFLPKRFCAKRLRTFAKLTSPKFHKK